MRHLLHLCLTACIAAALLPACGAAESMPDHVPAATAAEQTSPAEPFRRIEAQALHSQRAAGATMYVFDNNSAERYAAGHVPGAVRVAKDAVSATVLPADKAAMLVFYCGSPRCTACHDAARAAIGLGYSNVWIMPDGIKGWEALGLPVEKSATPAG